MLKPLPRLCAALLPFIACAAYATSPAPTQTFPLHDTQGLIAPGMKTEAVTYLGRKAVRLMAGSGEDHATLALLTGTDFQDGEIEADIALKALMPPEVHFPGFIGIAFRVPQDASHYDLFYVRPGNSAAPDQAMRNHAVQYVAEPDFSWYRLRREWPEVYESAAAITPNAWTHLRIEVSGRTAKLFLNNSPTPSLVVDGLHGQDLHGAIGLWGFTDEEAYFSNVRVTNALPAPVKNGSDAGGTWEVRYAADLAGMRGTMVLHRDGANVTGTWTGQLGQNCPIAGTWRDGFVNLSFPGTWPKEIRRGDPGPVTAWLSGWIDGDTAKGRMRVEGRSAGTWTAKRRN